MSIKVRSLHVFSTSRSDYASVAPIVANSLVGVSDNITVHLFDDVTFKRTPSYPNSDIIVKRLNTSIAVDKADVASIIETIHNTVFEISQADPNAAVFIIGDRWEILTIAQIAVLYGLVVIHHSGGDITNGAIDNKIRDSVSCLADYHLVSHPLHAARLVRMGEKESHICVVGEPSLNHLKHCLETVPTGINTNNMPMQGQQFILACFHASTLDIPISEQILFIQRVLALCHEHVVITYPNMDPGGQQIHRHIQSLARTAPKRITYLENLGIDYYNYLSNCYIVLGNSSSGIFEACMANKISINIGNRQAGRLKSPSVFDVNYNIEEVNSLYERIPELYKTLQPTDFDNPYYDKDCLEKIRISLAQICTSLVMPIKQKIFT